MFFQKTPRRHSEPNCGDSKLRLDRAPHHVIALLAASLFALGIGHAQPAQGSEDFEERLDQLELECATCATRIRRSAMNWVSPTST
jgi:hypothetical protein